MMMQGLNVTSPRPRCHRLYRRFVYFSCYPSPFLLRRSSLQCIYICIYPYVFVCAFVCAFVCVCVCLILMFKVLFILFISISLYFFFWFLFAVQFSSACSSSFLLLAFHRPLYILCLWFLCK
jgi:hypothetical protein